MRFPVRALAFAVCVPSLTFAQQAPRIRDSAGIRIVENASTGTAPSIRLGRLLASVGGLRDNANEEIESTGYESAVRFTDGRIAVAENQTVRVLTAEGKFVRLLGGRGGGPGQFTSQIEDMCLIRGDTLVVLGGRRVSMFTPNGSHVRSYATDHAPAWNSCAPDGSLLARAAAPNPYTGRSPAERSAGQQFVKLLRLTPQGRVRDTVGVFPGTIGLVPYSVVLDFFSAVTDGNLIHLGNGATAEVRTYSSTGQLVRILRWNDALVPVTAAMLDSLAAIRLGVKPNPSALARERARLRSTPQRPYLPVYTALMTDTRGYLWVREYFHPSREKRKVYAPTWLVFDNSGALLGRFIPPGVDGAWRGALVSVAAQHVVLRLLDGDNGVRVFAYALADLR